MSDLIAESKLPDVDSILRFLRGQNPYQRTSMGDGRNSVTAGLPGLKPQDRAAVTSFITKRLKTDDAVRERKAADAALKKDGEFDTTNFAEQIGRPLDSDSICKRLRKLNSRFLFERSNAFPDIMGIYLPDDHAPVRNGMRVRHIMGFESGFSPEFTVYHPDAKGPKKITRGWRSLILALAGGGYFNFNQACRIFDVERGRGSYHWQREIRQLKRIK
jgi:hypothetical protein